MRLKASKSVVKAATEVFYNIHHFVHLLTFRATLRSLPDGPQGLLRVAPPEAKSTEYFRDKADDQGDQVVILAKGVAVITGSGEAAGTLGTAESAR